MDYEGFFAKAIDKLKAEGNYRIFAEIERHAGYFPNASRHTENKKDEIKLLNLKTIFKDLKILFKKQGYLINWKDIEKQNIDQTINTLSMASPFSLEEKQVLLETNTLAERNKKLEEILKNYTADTFENTTLQ